ncbi:MAG TPA: ABC transporter permease [Bryobacteraceae bacterium]|nr:ABC transporter permease [Bryobacteraceae bacterium]
MSLLKSFTAGLRSLFRRRQADHEMDDDLRQFLEASVEDKIRRGMNRNDAIRAARVEMGSFESVKDGIRSASWETGLESFGRDLRHSVRVLRTNAGFSIVVILTLALGIGANTAIFSLFDALMLRALPIERPQELLRIGRLNPHYDSEPNPTFTNPLWEQIRDRPEALSNAFAWSNDRLDLSQGGAVQYANTLWVSGDYFRALGIRPAAGRLLTTGDDRRGCAPTAVLSNAFWQQRFGGDERAIGSSITLNNHAFQLVGVAPRGFSGITVGRSFDVAVPLCAADVIDSPQTRRLDIRAWWWLNIAARPKPGFSPAQINASLAAISPQVFGAVVPQNWDPQGRRNFVKSLLSAEPASDITGGIRTQFGQPLRVLLAIVGVVLLIACANIASLMMARSSNRRKEIAVRLALGASRARLIRQLLAESLLLSFAGAVLGTFVARWASALLVRYISTTRNQVFLDLSIDGRVLAFTAAIATLTGILFGILPAFRSTHVSLSPAMKGDADATPTRRLHSGKWIVSAQIALSLALVAAAGLFLRSFVKLASLEIGFQQDNVLIINTNLQTAKVPVAARLSTADAIESRLRAVPGVLSAAHSWNTPVSGYGWNDYVGSDTPDGPSGEDRLVWFNFISPGYFETLRTSLLSGRNFNAHDTPESQKVAIVSATFARKFFRNRDPIGGIFYIDPKAGKANAPILVVGVVKDSKYESLREETASIAFYPLSQIPGNAETMSFELRTAVSPLSLVGPIQSAVGEVNKAIPLDFRTLSRQLEDNIVTERVLALLSTFFGGLALLLAMVGLYGTLSYLVARRQKEFGVRMALGARPGFIVSLVMRDIAIVLAAGLGAGIAISLSSVGVLRKLLFGLAPRDAVTITSTVILLAAVAIVAAWLPARRAGRIDPMVALRHE